jgi:predicted transcriptional regulator
MQFIRGDPAIFQKMQNRQKDEIVRDILTVCNGGVSLTKLMCHAYLSHSQTKGYLGELVQKGWIEEDRLERKYRTTALGLESLVKLERMSELLPVQTRKAAKGNQIALF